MNAIDDPVIPDDLGALLRTGSNDLAVSPADLGSVTRRARQRRRRRHGLVICGTAAVVLLGAVAAVRLTTDDGTSERVVTATEPEHPAGSVPQPLLNRVSYGNEVSRDLRDESADGAPLWWRAPSGWQAVRGVVLADGRRFGVAVGMPGTLQQGRYRLSEVGADGATLRTDDLPIEAPDGWEVTSFRLAGATGTELILSQEIQTLPPDPVPAEGYAIETSTTVTALDVDTRATRTIVDGEPSGSISAAGDLLARMNGTDCTLILQPLTGAGAPRTVDGGCPPGTDGLEGMAMALSVSPDGRYVATVWNMIRPAGQPDAELIVIDATDGHVVYRGPGTSEHPARELAWTGTSTLSAAIDPGIEPYPPADGPVTVRSVEVQTEF